MPQGWFRLLDVGDLAPGRVRRVRIAGRDVVAFRTRSGRAGVLPAHCPHLGAHLGHGGRVVDEGLRCPFHGMRFGVDGSCVGVEPPHQLPVAVRARPYEVVEALGVVFVWLGVGAPAWPFPEIDPPGWTAPVGRTLRLSGRVEDVAENAVDHAHFSTVHGYRNLSGAHTEADGPTLRSRFLFDRAHPFGPFGDVTGVFDTDVHGLGVTVTRLEVARLGIRWRLYLFATPLEADRLALTLKVSAPLRASWGMRLYEAIRMRAAIPSIVRDILQDEPIWAHRAADHRPRPVRGDGPIPTYRDWADQFFEDEPPATTGVIPPARPARPR